VDFGDLLFRTDVTKKLSLNSTSAKAGYCSVLSECFWNQWGIRQSFNQVKFLDQMIKKWSLPH